MLTSLYPLRRVAFQAWWGRLSACQSERSSDVSPRRHSARGIPLPPRLPLRVIDQYQVKGESDPNREDDPGYIVRLAGQVGRISMETARLVKSLPNYR